MPAYSHSISTVKKFYTVKKLYTSMNEYKTGQVRQLIVIANLLLFGLFLYGLDQHYGISLFTVLPMIVLFKATQTLKE